VTVKFVIAPDGSTLNPEVVGAKHKEFEARRCTAVALMSYEPLLKDGKGVYVETTTALSFEHPDTGDFTVAARWWPSAAAAAVVVVAAVAEWAAAATSGEPPGGS